MAGDSSIGNCTIDPCHRILGAAGCPQPVDDRPVLRVFPLSKQVDGPVDIAVVIGELQQHCVDFEPPPLITIFELPVQRRHRPAVGPECLLVERVHEVRQDQVSATLASQPGISPATSRV